MKPAYDDICSRISEEPTWFDVHGVPRYGKFTPENASNIYAREVVLFEIACQCCGRRFAVENNWSLTDEVRHKRPMLSENVESNLGYGDPPIHGCPGDTMMSDNVRVLEFWKRDIGCDWRRVPELERGLPA